MRNSGLTRGCADKAQGWSERKLSRRSIIASAGIFGLSTVSTIGTGQSAEHTNAWPSDQFDNRNTGYNPEVSAPRDGVEHV